MNAAQDRRSALLAATKDLLWERGFESTSPRDIQTRSGAGQGSFYHHFDSKARLAAAALDEIADEMIANARDQLRGEDPLQRIRSYLTAPREALRGCRLGRLANEAGVIGNGELRAPIARYFDTLLALLATAIDDAKQQGLMPPDLPARSVAVALVAVVQGGYVLARIQKDERAMHDATDGALALLDATCN